MKLDIEIELSADLRDAFWASLENELAGMYDAGDKAYQLGMIDDVLHKSVEEWREETKKELGCFLMFRAGFQGATGWRCEDFKA